MNQCELCGTYTEALYYVWCQSERERINVCVDCDEAGKDADYCLGEDPTDEQKTRDHWDEFDLGNGFNGVYFDYDEDKHDG